MSCFVIKDDLEQKEIALCTFLNIESLFDNAPYGYHGSQNAGTGSVPSASRWVDSMLQNRHIQSSLLGAVHRENIITPAMELVVDGLLAEINQTGMYQAYAVDIAILVIGKYDDVVSTS